MRIALEEAEESTTSLPDTARESVSKEEPKAAE